MRGVRGKLSLCQKQVPRGMKEIWPKKPKTSGLVKCHEPALTLACTHPDAMQLHWQQLHCGPPQKRRQHRRQGGNSPSARRRPRKPPGMQAAETELSTGSPPSIWPSNFGSRLSVAIFTPRPYTHAIYQKADPTPRKTLGGGNPGRGCKFGAGGTTAQYYRRRGTWHCPS